MMPYIVIAIGVNGVTRTAFIAEPHVPDDFVQPGEIAFVIEPLSIASRHNHEVLP
jgi:hypothetical protein